MSGPNSLNPFRKSYQPKEKHSNVTQVTEYAWNQFDRAKEAWLPAISVQQNPTYVVLDIGCTKPMGSRPAIMAFAKAAKPYGIECEFLPTYAEFSFANSDTHAVYEKCRIWFPTTPWSYTDVDVLDKGSVPILLSLGQMRNLWFKLDMSPFAVLLTCTSNFYAHPHRTEAVHHNYSLFRGNMGG